MFWTLMGHQVNICCRDDVEKQDENDAISQRCSEIAFLWLSGMIKRTCLVEEVP